MADAVEGSNKTVGAVLVVGAGIGGMQAALDLADSGFKVYLADKGPAIGGTMAQLDKTFPTNDCAMCIMSPRLVETGRHLNIDILTLSEIESISGQAGDFTVRLRRQPRFVDASKCTGCGDCAAACPITRPDEFNAGLSTRKAVYKRYPQAIPNAFAIEKRGEAPCRNACPIEQRAMGYVALVREGRFADAYRTIREDNPFPAVCGRVCNHRCEDACSRLAVGDTPVSIMQLKRFVSDWARAHPEEVRNGGVGERENGRGGERVAIVGAGPAGLTAAQDLAKAGHPVTVFEALPVAGGMMRVGIPAYRLPYDEVQADVDQVLALGVELKLNARVDDVTALLDREHGFAAVFVATGAHAAIKLPIPGNDLSDVLVATEFLRAASLAAPTTSAPLPQPLAAIPGRRVLVIGGGNVAVDVAMTARRLGASWVGMACLESRERMPAHDWEVRDAEEEGIAVLPARTFKEIANQDGHVTGVATAAIDFRGFVDGRPDFDELPGTAETVPCDVVIFAIGQRPELGALAGKVATVRGRTIAVDQETLATDVPGIFAGGDAVTGTTFVVDAIAAGHRAARGIAAYLAARADVAPLVWPPVVVTLPRLPAADLAPDQAHHLLASRSQAPRVEPARRPAGERRGDFRPVDITISEAQAVEEAKRCLECGICSECLQCVYACRAGAVSHDDREQIVELNVGALILAPGLSTVRGDIRPEFGYGVYPNVVTSLEFERMLSASGPFAGVVQRPSDGRHPRRIAFIQCVGSRDLSCGQDYCSSVCCMYATKEAIIAREHDAGIEPTVFYMDIRAFGKGFERYYHRAEDEQGVRYVHAMPSKVRQVPGSQDLRVAYAGANGKGVEEAFDLVVLSVGLQPADDARGMAARLGVALDPFGFAAPQEYAPTHTNVPGIFVAGAFAAPKDIPETVIEASCAAANAARLLAPARGTLTRERTYPAERDVSREAPRVGVFVCHCGINIGGVVKVPEVVEFAAKLPGVVFAEHNLYTCSQDTQERIKQRIEEHGINRVVVASCTPRTHEPLFQDTIRQAGLNPYLFEMCNIREQDSWVHRADRDVATRKAQDLVAMAVSKAGRLKPLYRQSLEIDHRALVVGGGLAGMTAALAIAEQGYVVHLVEREDALGGNLRHIRIASSGDPAAPGPQALLSTVVDRVAAAPRIHVHLGAEVAAVSGYVGQYRTTLRLRDGSSEELEHGVAVIATGARAMVPDEYLYGRHPGVVTQRELEERMGEWENGGVGARTPSPLALPLRGGGGTPFVDEPTPPSPAAAGEGLGEEAAASLTRAFHPLPPPSPSEGEGASSPRADSPLSRRSGGGVGGGGLVVGGGGLSVVMIQCVGSRDDEHPYCSRICCTQAVKNALAIKRIDPAASVVVLYRDIRTYGRNELLYRQAREAGVVFLQYDPRQKPAVTEAATGLTVDVVAQPDGEQIRLDADLVVLSAGIEPHPDNEALAQQFKVPLSEDGFFLEAHAKLRPLDFAADGVYLAGLAHSPRTIEETVAQANGAAVRAARLLGARELQSAALIAAVNPRLCAACGICVDVCPYSARAIEGEGKARRAVVRDVLCQGCGACVAACPNGASYQRGFEFMQVFDMVDAALRRTEI